MKMKSMGLLAFATASILIIAAACGGGDQGSGESSQKEAPAAEENTGPKHFPKGIGEIKEVTLTDPMEESMIKSGKAIYEMKCAACHKLSDKRVVGPGWAGVSNRRRPEWVMNFITNVDVMLEEDSTSRAMLEQCLMRMPNQGLSVGDARDVLEFIRHNDIETVGTKDEAVTAGS